ncbi:MAG: hypothetical protein GY819_12665 [Planctomycetaceae bacterium]|nr:hypothetical protein [Planctomycetaceae bacterium]MCP4463641.1 hypothetical protein [Planctomycetaceae bacterium]
MLKFNTIALVIATTFAFSLQASAQNNLDDRANALFGAGMALVQETTRDTTSEIFQIGRVYSNAIQVASQNGDRTAASKLAAQFSRDVKRAVTAGIASADDNAKETQGKLERLLQVATVPSTISRIENYIGLLGVSFRVAKEEIFNAENAARKLVSNASLGG